MMVSGDSRPLFYGPSSNTHALLCPDLKHVEQRGAKPAEFVQFKHRVALLFTTLHHQVVRDKRLQEILAHRSS